MALLRLAVLHGLFSGFAPNRGLIWKRNERQGAPATLA